MTEYTAYSYLTPGEDFRGFELAPEFGRVSPYEAGLTERERERARRLLRESIVISLHDHPVRFRATSATLFNHYSLLGTAEQLLGLPALGAASSSPTMTAAFNL